ncbi:MAG TPA: winged helix-turn-helix transcriptional regulator [Nitrospirota bacterium]
MNKSRPSDSDHRFLQILDELSANDSLTQRDLSGRLGIALGLVNSYIKNLVAKGYLTVKAIPPKRYAYYLTPKGLAEKTRLTYHLLHDYTRIYREAKNNLRQLFKEMSGKGIRKVVFVGVDEVADIAYITLQETNLDLVGVVDGEKEGAVFFGRDIQSLQALKDIDYDGVVITSYLNREKIYKELISRKVKKTSINLIFTL